PGPLDKGPRLVLDGETRRDLVGELLQLLVVFFRIEVTLAEHQKYLVELEQVVRPPDLVGNLIGRTDQDVGHPLTERDEPLVPEPGVLSQQFLSLALVGSQQQEAAPG